MKIENKKEFKSLMDRMGVVFKENVIPQKIDIYFEALQDLSIIQIRMAIKNISREGKFFPVPAQIREACPPEEKKEALPNLPTESERKDNIKNAREIINKLNNGIKTMEAI